MKEPAPPTSSIAWVSNPLRIEQQDLRGYPASMEPSCPLPNLYHESVQLGHGGGGMMTHRLLKDLVFPAFDNPWLRQQHDGAVIILGDVRLAFTTDSYVVQPRFFPGGDIGSLAVDGTVNDLAMCGARPLHLSVGLIMEEGLAMDELTRVIHSMRDAAKEASVTLVTGDTKVVDRGHGDGLFVNTSGIGVIEHDLVIAPSSIQTGDAILLSGDLGRHGIAILAEREGLQFESTIKSDCAALHRSVAALLDAGIEVHCLRDLTRGGFATALRELASDSGYELHVSEDSIPVSAEVEGACELLGLDPLYVANEGRYTAIVPERQAEKALEVMCACPESSGAVRVGDVREESILGTSRILDRLSGEQLPRIC